MQFKSKLLKLKKLFLLIFQKPHLVKKAFYLFRHGGLREILYYIRSKINVVENNELMDLISLKPVANKWIKPNKLESKLAISVIIPTYNRAHMLEELIESWRKVDKATKYTYEIIFSDDGSSDNSIEILKAVKDLPIRVLANGHGGAAKARNHGIQAAVGEKLFIIGDDIFPNPEILNQHYEKLQELDPTEAILGEVVWHKELEVNYLMEHITEVGNEQFSYNCFPKHGYTDFRHFYTCNISIDREFLLSEETLFDEAFYIYGFEDIELGYRLAKKGLKIYYYPEAFGYHYHPYVVDKFINRQKAAGEMAVVFIRLHPEFEAFFQTEKIKEHLHTLETSLSDQKSVPLTFLDEIVDLTKSAEDQLTQGMKNEAIIKRELSNIYFPLFKFYFEVGILRSERELDKSEEHLIFFKNFAHTPLKQSLQTLADASNNSNIKRSVDTILAQFESFAKMQLTTQKKCTINVIANNADEKKLFTEKYTDLAPFVQPVLASEFNPMHKGDGDTNYYYHPENSKKSLSKEAIENILLFLSRKEVDFVLVSNTLHRLPNVGVDSLRNNLILASGKGIEDLRNGSIPCSGKLLNLVPGNTTDSLHHIHELLHPDVRWDEHNHLQCGQGTIMETQCAYKPGSEYKKTKKVVFVWPIFLAVGGVERNTVEIMKELKNEYDFVVVAMEKLAIAQGSLHQQFIDEAIAVIDLAELFEQKDFVPALERLKSYYMPDLIWICNGSPWLNDSAEKIRDMFFNIPIIDQQVYDTKVGWINRYHEKGVQSFDRFIAINEKIKKVFIEQKGLSENRINLIYSAVKKIEPIEYFKEQRNTLIEKFKINTKRKTFVLVGRMTEQKDPMLFLQLVKELSSRDDLDFIMVGDGELSPAIEQYIQKNLLSNVKRIKYLDNLAELYSVVDGMIITSKYEGLPIAMLEALCMGLPVFSTDTGDIRVVLEKYGCGSVFTLNTRTPQIVAQFNTWFQQLGTYKRNALKSSTDVRTAFSTKTKGQEYKAMWEHAIKEKETYVS